MAAPSLEDSLRRLIEQHSRDVDVCFAKEAFSVARRDAAAAETALRSKLVTAEFAGTLLLKKNDASSSAAGGGGGGDDVEDRAKRLRTNPQELALVKMDTDPDLTRLRQKAEEVPLTRALQVRHAAVPDIESSEVHRTWKCARVFAGHRGVPRAVAVDPSNRVVATGGMDNVVKILDVATGKSVMNFEGHSHPIRGLAFSPRHPYLFSASEDKDIKAWDLELNQLVRNYHGHTGGVYCVAVHPTLDTVISAGRDGTCRVWDMRTRTQVYSMTGHKDAIVTLGVQSTAPQVVTGSEDGTVRLWSLESGRCMQTLTYHKKGVRALVMHPNQLAFASASTGSVKKCNLPEGVFMQDFAFDFSQEPRTIVHSLAVARDGKFLAGGMDDGHIKFWDWTSAKQFQRLKVKTMPGTLETECGITAMAFDMTGERLFACVGDKTVQMFKPDVPAS